MGKSKLFFLIGLFFFFFSKSFAQTGCIGSLSGDLYLTNTSGTNYSYGGFVVASSSIYSTYCISSIASNGTCTITGVPFFGSVSGSLTIYGPLPCPIDNGIFFMIFGVFTFYKLFVRKGLICSIN
ncbi:hypothetical protein ACFOG5_10565 [Pedobacter fastidiosus]|uniref:hypothetical protein n=1 Tax=Pedobacter fastidiosus TaxID=2765361 RepID=UPI00360CADC0